MSYSKSAVLDSLDLFALALELLPHGKQRGDEWETRCPFDHHEDKNPSFGINLSTGRWKCFGCDESGDVFDLYGRLNGLSFPESVQALGKDSSRYPRRNGNHPRNPEKKPITPIPDSVVENLAENMRPQTYQWLSEHRVISKECARKYEIGLWEKNGQKRFAFPVRGNQERILNIRLWLPPVGLYADSEKRKTAGKVISWPDHVKGRGQARLYPVDQLKASSVVLCEGETDALALISCGIPAITATGGAGTWMDDWSSLFKNKIVTIAYDNDEAGRNGSKKVAASLIKAGARVKTLVWPKDRAKGYDVTDEALKSVESLKRLLNEALEWRRPEETNAPIKMELIRLSDVKPEQVRWLWPSYIPEGKITLIDGDPGLGKSTMILDIASRLSMGKLMPDGSSCTRGGTVLMTMEDGLSDTIRPRLDAAGADVSRIAALQGVTTEEGKPRIPTVADILAITQAVKEVGASLVIIDPLMAYLSGNTNSYKDQDMRRALSPLAHMAEVLRVAVVVVRHLNKSGGSQSIYRGGGSIGIIGAARCGLLVGKDPDDENRRILAGIKSNLGKIPESLSFHIEGNDGASKIAWGGTSNHTADKLLSIPASEEERSAIDEAKAFLLDLLSKGSVKVKQIKSFAQGAGISEKTLHRAKRLLSIKTDKAGFSEGWFWTLPKEELPQGGQEDSKVVTQNDDHLGEHLTTFDEKVSKEQENQEREKQWNLL